MSRADAAKLSDAAPRDDDDDDDENDNEVADGGEGSKGDMGSGDPNGPRCVVRTRKRPRAACVVESPGGGVWGSTLAGGTARCAAMPLAEREEFGLVDDCAPFPGVFEYACAVAGASLQGADLLARGSCSVAINWGGGRHHAKRDRADGFCFVNDVVLALLHLLRRFRRVLYFDIDVHHGDGVQVRATSCAPNRHRPSFPVPAAAKDPVTSCPVASTLQ